jgi:DnaJ family protein C protein 7
LLTDALRRSHIDLVATEPAYLTNRAAAYIAIKRFRPALADCQQAISLQSPSTHITPSTPSSPTTPLSASRSGGGAPASPTSAPPPKTLLRLARCQLALAQTAAALSTLREVLAAEPGNAQATQAHARALELEAHVRNLDGARRRGEWGLARIALYRCLGVVEAEGSEIPIEWRLWRVEIELARGNWDSANSAAKYVRAFSLSLSVLLPCYVSG